MQSVLLFVKPDCPSCRRQQKTIRRLMNEVPHVRLYDCYQDKLEAELAKITETPTAIVTWDGTEQYRTTDLLELF